MPTRREFLESSVAFAAALGIDVEELAPGLRVRRQQRPTDHGPEMVVINARVYTMDDALPRAQAFAVKNGRFLAVGSTSDIRNLATRGTELIDAAGLTIVPGFIDAHCHPSGVNELIGVNVNLRTVEEVKAALRKKAAATPPGYWVTGYMYDDTKLDRPVTRKDLDEAVPDHPAMVAHRGGHTAVYNSKAFELAGVTAETPDPPGGKFYRENGELTGKVAERARAVFDKVGKREEITRETRRAGVKFISGLPHVFLSAGRNLPAAQGRGGEDRFRGRVAAHRTGEVHRRRLGLGAHHADEYPLCGAAGRLRDPHHDPGRDPRSSGGRPSQRLEDRHPRQRRRYHRHGAQRVREGATPVKRVPGSPAGARC